MSEIQATSFDAHGNVNGSITGPCTVNGDVITIARGHMPNLDACTSVIIDEVEYRIVEFVHNKDGTKSLTVEQA